MEDEITVIDIITVVLSFSSLIVSLVVAWRNRKDIHVEIQGFYEIIGVEEVYVYTEFEDIAELGKIKDPYGPGLLTRIDIVNPSPRDIAFFDLRCFYPETNQDAKLLTRRAMIEEDRKKTVWRTIKDNEGNEKEHYELIIPDKDHGVLKAGSLTKFDILMVPSKQTKELNFSFKIAKRTWFKRDQFAVTGRKKFKFFGYSYDTTAWYERFNESNF